MPKTITAPVFTVVVPSDVEMVEKKTPTSVAYVFVHEGTIVMIFMATPEPMPTMECDNQRGFLLEGHRWTEEMCRTRDASWLVRHAKIGDADWYLNARNPEPQLDWVEKAMDSFQPIPGEL